MGLRRDVRGLHDPEATSGETYESKEKGFSITGPPGWKMIIEEVFYGDATFLGPKVGAATRIFMIADRDMEDTGGMSLNEYVEASLLSELKTMDVDVSQNAGQSSKAFPRNLCGQTLHETTRLLRDC